ncbi:MAG TPA: M15 family metallopeptidase [Thermoanaerobaculia bacterium]|nr:M15 family metallopeptidase [Thermoanaerobaculia bacterium]
MDKRKDKAGRKGKGAGKSSTAGKGGAAGETRGPAKQAARGEATRATATSTPAPATRRTAARSRRIDVVLKGLAVAAEPPIDANPGHLDPVFRNKLQAVLTKLAGRGTPFRLVEGFCTRARQQWLFGSGRPNVVPFGRPGPILTNADGVDKPSRHQGNGTPGSGLAADCYPTREGRVFIPPSSDPIWTAYADAVEAEGLAAGHRFPTLQDSPHCELR